MGLLESFKNIAKEYEIVSRYDGNIIDEDELIYDLYYSILREGCSSKNVIDDEVEMLMYIMNHIRSRKMLSVFELLCSYYYIKKKPIDEIFNEMHLN